MVRLLLHPHGRKAAAPILQDHTESETPTEPFWLSQLAQYQGAGALTGFGLLRWHMAQRKRLPLKADFGRVFLPVLRIFSAITTSVRILSETLLVSY